MSIVYTIKPLVTAALKKLYGVDFEDKDLTVNSTKPEFEGDYTIVLFSFVKMLRKSPEQIGQELGPVLVESNPEIFSGFNVIKGFLNLTIYENYWIALLNKSFNDTQYGTRKKNNQKVIVEYSSPNTNKPLHLGHLRNNFLGWSISAILEASGYDVVKTCIVNDRGIHICKSMLAWQKFANGATPESTGTKGDHFVGDYYVKFEELLKEQSQPIIKRIYEKDFAGLDDSAVQELTKLMNAYDRADDDEKIKKIEEEIKEIARNQSPVMQEAKTMLRKWEAGDAETVALWKKMNSWVYEGFDITYKKIGTDFSKMYYESETYIPGKRFVEEGLKQGVFFKKEDGSVWIDLSAEGLDEKLVLRKDGTSVYITQDLGLAEEKYTDFHYDESLYVIADEQNYHMKVLELILRKLGKPYANGIKHMSYGMVELPEGRMKSREGTVVDADDIVQEMINVARQKTVELGKVKDFNETELARLYDILALGALKFFLIRVDPKKRIVFNPEESIDFHGFTGPFIQYTHARIRSILRKADEGTNTNDAKGPLLKLEKDLLVQLEQYPSMIDQACKEDNPSLLAIYSFNLAKLYNTFYTEHSVLSAESAEKKLLRLKLSEMTANTLRSAMGLLGIEVPDRM